MLGQTPQSLAKLHAGADYRAYMYGFAPGWCYLGGLPQALAIPRRASPRGPTPQGGGVDRRRALSDRRQSHADRLVCRRTHA